MKLPPQLTTEGLTNVHHTLNPKAILGIWKGKTGPRSPRTLRHSLMSAPKKNCEKIRSISCKTLFGGSSAVIQCNGMEDNTCLMRIKRLAWLKSLPSNPATAEKYYQQYAGKNPLPSSLVQHTSKIFKRQSRMNHPSEMTDHPNASRSPPTRDKKMTLAFN